MWQCMLFQFLNAQTHRPHPVWFWDFILNFRQDHKCRLASPVWQFIIYCQVCTDLRVPMPSPADIHLLLDLPSQRIRLCWRSPVHGSGRNHGPTPEEWSPRWLECLGLSVRCAGERPATQIDWRLAEGNTGHLPNARSMENWRHQQIRPDQTHGLNMRRRARPSTGTERHASFVLKTRCVSLFSNSL